MTEYMPEFSCTDEDHFGADLPDDIYALRELAETLRGRKKDVYEAMLDNLACGKKKITNVELARKWCVSESLIRQDQKMIIKMIKKSIDPKYQK